MPVFFELLASEPEASVRAVILLEKRDEYIKTLDQAGKWLDIEPFARFIAYLVKKGLTGKPVATLPN